MPSLRSRLTASGVTFLLGFAMANYALLKIVRPDQWLWIVVAVILMLTGALGVVFSDMGPRYSMWAILGFEILVGFTVIPLGWVLSIALQPSGKSGSSLLPQNPTGVNFSQVFHSAAFGHAALNSLIIAASATAISIVLGFFGAYGLVRRRFRGARIVYAYVLVALLTPMVVLAGPMASQAFDFGLFDTKRALVFAELAVTLPLALWLFVSAFSRLPWGLRDVAHIDGAGRWHMMRHIYLPVFAPSVIAVAFIDFFIAYNDLVLGKALGVTNNSLTVPAALTLFGNGTGTDFNNAPAAIAAAGAIWLVPVLLFVLIFQHRIAWLVGRPDR